MNIKLSESIVSEDGKHYYGGPANEKVKAEVPHILSMLEQTPLVYDNNWGGVNIEYRDIKGRSITIKINSADLAPSEILYQTTNPLEYYTSDER